MLLLDQRERMVNAKATFRIAARKHSWLRVGSRPTVASSWRYASRGACRFDAADPAMILGKQSPVLGQSHVRVSGFLIGRFFGAPFHFRSLLQTTSDVLVVANVKPQLEPRVQQTVK
jgi:hypothetical protein